MVGVVDDVRYRGLNDVRLDTYVPAAQSNQRVRYLMVRATRRGGRLAASVRAAAIAVDPRASVADAGAMADIVAAESAPWRFVVRVFLAFATLAALLSAIGLGTVIALAVSTRRRELAIRAALGADRRRLRAVVMKEGTLLVGLGVLPGWPCALALGRAVAAVLVGVQPHDPIALLTAATLALSRRAHRLLVAVATGVRRPIPSRRCGRSSQRHTHSAPHSAPGTCTRHFSPARQIPSPRRRAPAPSRASRRHPAA